MNDPLAYFITFSCKGARLPGDPRGSVDRDHNTFGAEFVEPNPIRAESEANRMDHPPVVLDPSQRAAIKAAIQGVAVYRCWTIHACAVRSNHVHVVVSAAGSTPERVMQDFKAYATRRLRQAGLVPRDLRPWTRHGSTIYLWNENAVAETTNYVRERQDDPERYASEPRL